MFTHVFIFCAYLMYQFAGCLKMFRVQIVVFLVVTSHDVVNEYRSIVKTSSKWLRHLRQAVKCLVCKVP